MGILNHELVSPSLRMREIHLSWQVTAARNMPHFLRYLTAQVHKLVPGGQVVWYDSVLQSGELKWQNELNENNR